MNIMRAFLEKLNAVLNMEDQGPGKKKSNVYTAFCSPGTPLTPSQLRLGLGKYMGNLAQFSVLVNTIPDTTGNPIIWRETGARVWDVYANFLSFARPINNERIDIPPPPDPGPIAAKVENLHAEEYLKHKANYENQVLAYNNALFSAQHASQDDYKMFTRQGRRPYQEGITKAYQAWLKDGFKEDYEAAAELRVAGARRSLTAALRDLESEFRLAGLTDPNSNAQFWPTQFIPGDLFSGADASIPWTTFKFSAADATSAKLGAALGAVDPAGLGFRVAAADGEARAIAEPQGPFNISLNLIKLPLLRGWFRVDFLTSAPWRWDARRDFGMVSEGRISTTSKCLMPAYPVAVLIAKDISVECDAGPLKRALQEGANVSLGPLGLGSAVAPGEPKPDRAEAVVGDNGVKSTGLSVLGYVCEILPKLPASATAA